MTWAPTYAFIADFKDYVPSFGSDTVDDNQLSLVLEAASRAVDRFCNRQFGNVSPAQQRFYQPSIDWERRTWVVDIDDLQNVTGLVVLLDGVDVTSKVVLTPRNALQDGEPYISMDLPGSGSEVAVTALWGWLAVPVPVKLATLMQAARFFKRRVSPFGIAGSPETGSELRLLAKVDPDVSVTLTDFQRLGAAA